MSRGFLFGGLSFDTTNVGQLMLVSRGIAGDGSPRPRVLWSTRKVQAYSGGITFSRHPAVNGTRELIKAIRKLRGESK